MTRLLAVLAATLLTTGTALAQPYPGDPGAGVQRGIEQLNNSGQVGTVTLYDRGSTTRVDLVMQGTTGGRAQSARLYRGPSCDDIGTAGPAYFLTDVKNGRSVSTIKAPAGKLLSGNYNVVVFSSNAAGARSTACGHLYAS